MEMNPNHAVTSKLREHWQRMAALLVAKAGGHVVITLPDIKSLPDGIFLTIQELNEGIHFRLVDEATAVALARKEGGLPT